MTCDFESELWDMGYCSWGQGFESSPGTQFSWVKETGDGKSKQNILKLVSRIFIFPHPALVNHHLSATNNDANPKKAVLTSKVTLPKCATGMSRQAGMIYKLEGTGSIELVKEEVIPSGEVTSMKETLVKVTEASAEWKVISEDICNDTSEGDRYHNFRVICMTKAPKFFGK